MLTEEQARALIQKILKLSPARATEATVEYNRAAATRFANNQIIQNVEEEDLQIAIRVLHQTKMGRAETNLTDPDALAFCCEKALHLAKHAAPDPDLLPLPGRQNYDKSAGFFNQTLLENPAFRAHYAVRTIAGCEQAGARCAGVVRVQASTIAIGNSQGLFAFAPSTQATVSLTANLNDRTGSEVRNHSDIEQIDIHALVSGALDKARRSANVATLPPGEYTVVLEPLAVLSLLAQLVVDYIAQISHFSGTAVYQKLGFVSGRIGEQIFGANFSLNDDVYHPLHQGIPFDGEGMPRMPVILVHQGILSQLVHNRKSALQLGELPTGHALPLPNPYGAVPQHLVMLGGSSSIEEMVRKTQRGIYVSRFWYNRLIDPAHLLVTGMTRDGTFLIEGGEIVCGLENMRFNESLFKVFRQISDLGQEVRTYDEESGQIMVVPPVRVEDFRFMGCVRT